MCCGTTPMAIEDQGRWYLRHFDPAGEVIADVGAHVGALSQFLWDHADARTRLVSVEPLPENLKALTARARAAASPRWSVKGCAVSDHEGTVWMQTVVSGAGREGVVREGPAPDRFEVPCRTLPQVAPDATIVKLDVEGHEHAILDHALARMPNVHTWAVELHHSATMPGFRPLEATIAAFEAVGLEVYAAVQRKDDPHVWRNARIRPSLGWHRIPAAIRRADGSVFKMLHIVARRPRP